MISPRQIGALCVPLLLSGCLNAASGDIKPAGSQEAVQLMLSEEPLVRRMIAQSMSQTQIIKGGLLVGRYRTSNAVLAGPHIQQDPINQSWGVFYCVKSSMNAVFHPEFKALAVVEKTPTGWKVSTMDARVAIGCHVNPRPFPEFDVLTNKFADGQEAAKRRHAEPSI